ncbi:MAG: cysteine desulfurase family protein [Pseudomonadota bacterium]
MMYFDYNASSPILPEAREAMMKVMTSPLNPSSVHSFGRNAKSLIENARNDTALALGVNLRKDQYNLVFTSSATEANNLVMNHFKGSKILISATEHISILKHAEYKQDISILKVDNEGVVDLEVLESYLKAHPGPSSLVSIMLANNETGVIQPISDIAAIVHKYGAVLHSDCVQGLGKISCNILELGVDFASISAHKFGGPLGAAALVHKAQYHMHPHILGGGQERSVRSGTENVPAIVGMGVAASIATPQTSKLRDIFESGVRDICKDAIIFGRNAPRLPNTSMVYMPNVPANLQVISFDIRGMAVSSGSACSSGKVKISHVLIASGVEARIADCAIRFSFGISNTEEEIEKLAKAWGEIYRDSQGKR